MLKAFIKEIPFAISLLFIAVAIGFGALIAPIDGNKALIVRSGSMEPIIAVGSLITAKPQPKYNIGDVVAFKDTIKSSVFVTHRIVNKKEQNGKIYFQTKGDANEEPDFNFVPAENIVGRANISIPSVGKLVAYTKTKQGFATAVIFPAVLVIFFEIVNIFKEIKKQKRQPKPPASASGIIPYTAPQPPPVSSYEISHLSNLIEVLDITQYPIRDKLHFRLPSLKIILPLVLSTLLVYNTFAFFTDTETSIGNIFRAADSFGEEEQCVECEGEVVADENVTVDLNPAVPTCDDGTTADLCDYFNFDKSGANAGEWKAIFDLENKKLKINSGVTVTTVTSPVTGSERFAPGIEIFACQLEISAGGKISVVSQNRQAGDIFLKIERDITINGEIRNEVTGTNGLPGKITIASVCGDILTGTTSRIIDEGIDRGGNVINIVNCCKGNITLNGLVMSRAHAHAGDLTQNRPMVRVAAFAGTVTVNANTTEPLLDEHSYGGTAYDLWGGLLSWVSTNSNPGKVEVQASGDITVNGHGIDPTAPARESFGAIAAIATASSAPGGLVDVRSIGGNIIGNDRAFDVSGKNRLTTNFAHINLFAKNNITTSRLGANNNFNPVVDASSPAVGDKGGTNELRSYSGGITNNTNAIISASVPAGTGTVQGVNLLTSCTGVVNNGTVTPPDANGADDLGQCSPDSPTPLFAECSDFGIDCFCSPTQASRVVINEVYYDVGPGKGNEGDNADPDEWVELYNNTGSPINLKNWTITDNDATRIISATDVNIPTNGFVLLSKNASTWTLWSEDPGAVIIAIGEKIGNGLANTGDRLILKNHLGAEIDAMSYGTDTSILNPSAADVAEGHSLERFPPGADIDSDIDFIDRNPPTPGI